VPVSYFSVNDLLNLIVELRSFPELETYFASCAALPDDTRQTLGGESFLYERYLINEGGFGGWRGFEDAESRRAARPRQLREIQAEKHRLDASARFVEVVIDCLSTRLANHEQDLSPEILLGFDPADWRENYLTMQEELCDLSLVERRALGQLRTISSRKSVGTPPPYATGCT
jgi:hypothetical protein